MSRVLADKNQTRGRNTSLFGLLNLHRCVSPSHQEHFGPYVARVMDHAIDTPDGLSIPMVDFDLAIRRHERLRKSCVVGKSENHRENEISAEEIAMFRPQERLAWGLAEHPLRCTWKTIADVCHFHPYETKAFLAADFLVADISDAVWNMLINRQCGTTNRCLEWAKSHNAPGAKSIIRRLGRSAPPNWLHLIDTTSLPQQFAWSSCEYIHLLGTRRTMINCVTRQMASYYGRDVSNDEVFAALRGIRGMHAQRACDRFGESPVFNGFVDDEFVVLSILFSIAHGSDAVLLTSRTTVQQAFIAVNRMVDHHYRCWCVAPVAKTMIPAGYRFSENRDVRMERLGYRGLPFSAVLRPEVWEQVLPRKAIDLHLMCWRIRFGEDETSIEMVPVSYLSECPVQAMFAARSETRGMSHQDLSPSDIQLSMESARERAWRILLGEPSWLTMGADIVCQEARRHYPIDRLSRKDVICAVNHSDLEVEATDDFKGIRYPEIYYPNSPQNE